MMDDGYPVECPQCGEMALSYQCWNGCEDGYFDLYDEDPIYYEPGEMERCLECNGKGSYTICRTCGYDSTKPKKVKTP